MAEKLYTQADLRRARQKAFQDAVQAIRNIQESFVVNGGRSNRDREQRARQRLYIRGLDDARGAVEIAYAENPNDH